MSFKSPYKRLTKAGKNEALKRELFIAQYLRYPGNDDTSYGKPFLLEEWQKKVVNAIFGTGKMVDGQFQRHYNRALIGVPRGVGKTVLACAMVLAEASVAPVFNGQYGIIADSVDNAQNGFSILCNLIRMSPVLSRIWQIYKKEVRNIETGARMSVFPNKVSALQGWHFNLCVCDEVHIYKNEEVWEAVVSGQRNIRNSLALAITTAGAEREGFLWNWITRLKEGGDPGCYYYWIGLDDDDDAKNRQTWRKVMVSKRITKEGMEDQLNAMGPRAFERYQLNRFPMEKEEEPFMKRRDVQQCQKLESRPFDFDNWFVVGIDGATSGDTLAVVAVQQDGDGFYNAREWIWDKPGPQGVYDLMEVGDVIEMLAMTYGKPLIVCDPSRLQMLKNWLYNERDIELYDFNQTPRQMCPASELLATRVKKHDLIMADTPFLAQHSINAVSAESKAYGRRLSSVAHGQGSRRIDAAVAGAMALSAYDTNLHDNVSSYNLLSIAL